MKNGSGKIGMDGRGSRVEPRHSNAQTTRLIGSSASCMNVRSSPKGLRSASATRRYAKTASMLLVCAAAIFIISSVATLPVGKVMAIGSGDPSVEEPLPPYYIAGYTYDALGTILPFCDVNVTDKTTDAYMVGTSSDLGFYMLDVKNGMVSTGGFTAGDVINVTATKDLAVGWNETVSLAGSFTPIDVTLDAMIPEFPMVALPVVGLLAMFIVVSVRRRGKQ